VLVIHKRTYSSQASAPQECGAFSFLDRLKQVTPESGHDAKRVGGVSGRR
jgi:hypothetical protein